MPCVPSQHGSSHESTSQFHPAHDEITVLMDKICLNNPEPTLRQVLTPHALPRHFTGPCGCFTVIKKHSFLPAIEVAF